MDEKLKMEKKKWKIEDGHKLKDGQKFEKWTKNLHKDFEVMHHIAD